MGFGFGEAVIPAVIKRGARTAVRALATRAAASLIAQKTGGKVDDIFAELTDHLVSRQSARNAGDGPRTLFRDIERPGARAMGEGRRRD
jgi:hypothetical protein